MIVKYTKVTIYLQNTSRVYDVPMSAEETMKAWESGDNLLIPYGAGGYTYIRKDQCPIVEFEGWERIEF